MEFLNEFIIPIVVGICLCAGFVIKHFVPSDKINKWIPAFVALLGVFINIWHNQWGFTPEILLGGMVSGLASTGMYEMFKNFIEMLTKKDAA
jgi:hypothetical protein